LMSASIRRYASGTPVAKSNNSSVIISFVHQDNTVAIR
jgi:hypothetical protein